MSDFFKDKVVDELENSDEGWLTLAIEPYTYSLFDRLAEVDLPTEYEITYDDVMYLAGNGFRNITEGDVVKMLLNRDNIKDLKYEDIKHMLSFNQHVCFVASNNLVINLAQKEIVGSLKFVMPDITEESLPGLIHNKVVSRMLYSIHNYIKDRDIGTLNEIMSLLECKEHLKGRSQRKKIIEITNRFATIIKDDEWKIRDCDLILKATDWLRDACNGNIHGIANLTKLKCMTYSGKVIYSMEEIV